MKAAITNRTRGAVAAGHPKTAEAGIEMLRLGGNAFDAVVAGILAACVVEPTLTSLAGGGFLLAHTCHKENILFDFFTQTPRCKGNPNLVDFYPVSVDFGSATQEFHVGLGSMAVPGTAAGLFHVQQRLGRLPFHVVTEPAIHYARTGVEVGDFQSYCFTILSPILLAAPEMRQVCAPTGTFKQAGEILTLPVFADTLSEFAKTGPALFYEGAIAHQIAADCEQKGGYLTLEDLKNYRVIERTPLTANYRGNTLLTNPAPSSGGGLIAFALQWLEKLDLGGMKFGEVEAVRSLAEAMRQTNLARNNLADHPINKLGSTTHISAIDSEGNAASSTTSNGEGSSYMIPGTGIMVNNMLGEADLHPNGFHQWQENVRIASMMAPTMILQGNQPEIVLGSGGSNRIRTAILQVICNVLDFQMSVHEAVQSPRIHWEAGVMNVEPGFDRLAIDRTQFPFDDQLILWDAPNMFFGGVHAVMRDADGELSGSGDFRRSGAVATLN